MNELASESFDTGPRAAPTEPRRGTAISGPERLRWEDDDAAAALADRAAAQRRQLLDNQQGEAIALGNEFAQVRVCRVETRNGSRLLIESPRSGRWVALCPLELEALTWQNPQTFSAMIGNPFGPLVAPDEEDT